MITVGRIVEMLDSKSVKEVSKEVGIAEKKIRETLKNQGFYWNNSEKSWEFKGSNIDVALELPISNIKSTRKKHVSNTNDSNVLQYIADNVTISELESIIDVTRKLSASNIDVTNVLHGGNVDVSYELFKRVNNEIDKDIVRTRKAYPISEELQKNIDDFSKKHKIDKQELIELALKDFFKTYQM